MKHRNPQWERGVGAEEVPEGHENVGKLVFQYDAILSINTPCAGFFQPIAKGSEFRGYQRLGSHARTFRRYKAYYQCGTGQLIRDR